MTDIALPPVALRKTSWDRALQTYEMECSCTLCLHNAAGELIDSLKIEVGKFRVFVSDIYDSCWEADRDAARAFARTKIAAGYKLTNVWKRPTP